MGVVKKKPHAFYIPYFFPLTVELSSKIDYLDKSALDLTILVMAADWPSAQVVS